MDNKMSMSQDKIQENFLEIHCVAIQDKSTILYPLCYTQYSYPLLYCSGSNLHRNFLLIPYPMRENWLFIVFPAALQYKDGAIKNRN